MRLHLKAQIDNVIKLCNEDFSIRQPMSSRIGGVVASTIGVLSSALAAYRAVLAVKTAAVITASTVASIAIPAYIGVECFQFSYAFITGGKPTPKKGPVAAAGRAKNSLLRGAKAGFRAVQTAARSAKAAIDLDGSAGDVLQVTKASGKASLIWDRFKFACSQTYTGKAISAIV